MKIRQFFQFLAISCISLVSMQSFATNQNGFQNGFMNNQPLVLAAADKAKNQGEAFLAANKNRPGVVTLPDGLQYKVISPGSGAKPTAQDIVTVHYSGKLINGTEFDSSYKRGEPTTFPVSGVIPGWVEALQLMNEGATWEIYVPAALAYGEQGVPPSIGPNEALIFKIQLIAVKKPQ